MHVTRIRHNEPRANGTHAPRIVEEMRGHALAYFTEHGHDSLVGHWLWNLAFRIEMDLCPPATVLDFTFPRQRRAT